MISRGRFFAISAILLVVFCYFFSHVLVPFFIAAIFAYLLMPAVDYISNKFKLSRSIVSFLVFCIFISILFLIILTVVPIIYDQMTAFIKNIPKYRSNIENSINLYKQQIENDNIQILDDILSFSHTFVQNIFSAFLNLTSNIWGYTVTTIHILLTFILFPIVLFYFLKDWPKLKRNINSTFKLNKDSEVHKFCLALDKLIAAYLRGQLNVCLMMSCYYTVAFLLIKLDLAILLGTMTGFLIIIPILGTAFSFVITLITCYFSYGFSFEFLCVILVFSVAYVFEGYYLSPKIVGDKIGVHPVIMILSVFVSGTLFGIVGVLFAVPIAGISKLVLVTILKYQNEKLDKEVIHVKKLR